MKNTLTILAALLALTATPARAQFAGDFTQPKLGPAWSFTVPGNTPADTADPAHYHIANGALSITLQPGSLWRSTAHNIPAVLLSAASTGDYTIETRVTASFDKVDGYPSGGIVVLADTANALALGLKHNNYKMPNVTTPKANYNFVDVISDLGSKADARTNPSSLSNHYANVSEGAAPQAVTLTLKKSGATITFSYATASGKTGTALTLTASDTGSKKAAYDFLSSLGGRRVGLYADADYTKDTETVSFGYLHLTGLTPATP